MAMQTIPGARPAPADSLGAYLHFVRRDAPFHWFVALYALLGLLVAVAAGVPHKFVPLSYVAFMNRTMLAPIVFCLVVAGIGLASLRSPAPLGAAVAMARKVFNPRAAAGLLLFASLTIFLGVFSSMKSMLPDIVPFFADSALADVDAAMHGGLDPWRYTTAVIPPFLTPYIAAFYFGIWSLLLSASMLAVLVARSLRDVRAQYVWTVVIAWPLLGNMVAGAFMSAGPIFFEAVTGEARFSGLVEYLAQHTGAQEATRVFLWNSYVSGQAGPGSGISAFPSMHIANSTLFVLLANRISRSLTWAALGFLAVILFGSVHLGWHYAVDGYFSIAATVLIWKAVGWALGLRSHAAQHP
jgi:hypothetical protein